MSVLNNNMFGAAVIANAAAGGGGSGYQIEKSLRFNSADSSYLRRTPTVDGNRRTWTIAFWWKQSTQNSVLWQSGNGSGQNYIWFHHESDGQIRVYDTTLAKDNTWTANFRDPGAWQHICFVMDTTNIAEDERIRLYINGKRNTNFQTKNMPAQYAEGENLRAGVKFNIGRNEESVNYYNGYLSDFYQIDGLALSPAAFGSFDSTGVFNAKEFAVPTPNADTTWSGMLSSAAGFAGSGTNNGSPTKAFNGRAVGTDFYTYTPGNTRSEANAIVFTPTGGLEINQSLEFWSGRAATSETVQVEVDMGNGYEPRITSTSGKWITLFEGKGTLTKFKTWASAGNGGENEFAGIKVDGVELIDGKTDPATRTNPNNGTTWSDSKTTSANTSTSNDTQAFNGTLADGATLSASSQGNNSVDYSVGSIANVTRVELYISGIGSNGEIYGRYNATNGTASGNLAGKAAGWYTVYSGSAITLTSVGMILNANSTSGGGSDYVRAFRVNGHILVDSTVDNSFHLKFNDTSRNSALGKDTLNGKIADADGGKPFYVTSDNYGEVKGSGYNSEASNAIRDALVFALPGDGLTDEHDHVNTGSSAKNIINNGTTATSTTESRFYGTSLEFNGTDKYLEVKAANGDKYADFAFGNGDFTAEAWVYANNWDDSYAAIINNFRDDDSTTGWSMLVKSGGQLHVNMMGDYTNSTTLIPTKEWVHLAIVRDGSENKLYKYINGVQDATINTGSQSITNTTQGLCVGGAGTEHSRFLDGWLQDVRIYKGVAKYTANFTPPTRNDFTVNNLETTEVTGSSGTFTGTLSSIKYRLTRTGNSSAPELYGVEVNGTVLSSSSGLTLSQSGSGGTWSNAFDDDTSTRMWPSAAEDQWIKIVWDTPITISSQIKLFAYGPNDYGIKTYLTINDGDEFEFNVGQSTATWYTVQNIVSAKSNDSLVDTPTNYGTDTGAGGEVRGNYCTWNPLMTGDSTTQTFSQGNLEWKNSGVDAWTGGTLGVRTGSSDTNKWYWEVEIKHGNGGYGICNFNNKDSDHSSWGGGTDRARFYLTTNGKLANPAGGSDLTYGSNTTSAVGDVIGVALDLSPGGSSGKITFYKNGTSLGVAHTDIDTTRYWTPFICDYGGDPKGGILNAGQRAFKYTPPTDHKCLCTGNFTDTFSGEAAGTVNNPSKYFDTKLRMGSDDDTAKGLSGLNFQPDLVWDKSLTSGSHALIDAIRGATKYLTTNSDGGQTTNANYFSAFTSDGFTTGNVDHGNTTNVVSWCWDTGTAAVTPSTDGSLTLLAQWKNASAGFSMSTWDGTGSNATVGHGLGATPDFIIVKLYDGSNEWSVYHKDLGPTLFIVLEDPDDSEDNHEIWNDTSPTNTVYSISTSSRVNGSGHKYIGYAWTSIPGYSAFGSFVGNGAAQGPFNYTGFKPKWILLKRDGNAYWQIHDTERSTYNGSHKTLFPNSSAAESSDYPLDILSNGFLTRDAGSNIQYYNNANDKILWAAFAEHPFKTSRAR